MAKTSMIEREKKRARTVQTYAKKSAALKAVIGDRKRWQQEVRMGNDGNRNPTQLQSDLSSRRLSLEVGSRIIHL